MAKMEEDEKERRKSVMLGLRECLARNKKTQRWLATELGIYHGYVSNLLTGKQIPSVEVVGRAIQIMGVMGPVGDSPTTDVPTSRLIDVEKTWRKSKRQGVTKENHSPPMVLRRAGRDATPSFTSGTRVLTPDEILAVADLTVSLIKSSPCMDADELIMVIKGFSRGFASTPG